MIPTRYKYAKRLLAMFERVTPEDMTITCPGDTHFETGGETLKDWRGLYPTVNCLSIAPAICRMCMDFIDLTESKAETDCPCGVLGIKKAVRRGNKALDKYFIKGTHKWLV